MKTTTPKPVLLNYLTKLILILFFFGFFIFFILRLPEIVKNFHPTLLDLLLLGFATLRTGRALSYDLVAEPLRFFFTHTVPDEMGMGDGVEPVTNAGARGAIGQLLACPICTGTWVAAFFVYLLYLWPDPARLLFTILAATGIAEVLNSVVESLCWSADSSHMRAAVDRAVYKSDKAVTRQESPNGHEQPR